MALIVLRSFFVMVTVGIAVLIVNSEPMREAPTWAPLAVIAGSVALPLAVMAIDAVIRRKDLTTITAVYFGLLVGVFLTYVAMLALTPVPTPGPLPLLGVGVAFAQARRLRRRCGGLSRSRTAMAVPPAAASDCDQASPGH
jgi:hypothetical protein